MIKKTYKIQMQGGAIIGSAFLGSIRQGDNLINEISLTLVEPDNETLLMLSDDYQLYLHGKRSDDRQAYIHLNRNSDNSYSAEIPNWFTAINGKLECNIEFRKIKHDYNENDSITIYEENGEEKPVENEYYISFSEMFSFNVERSIVSKSAVASEYDQFKDLETRIDLALDNVEKEIDTLNALSDAKANIEDVYTKEEVDNSFKQKRPKFIFYPTKYKSSYRLNHVYAKFDQPVTCLIGYQRRRSGRIKIHPDSARNNFIDTTGLMYDITSVDDELIVNLLIALLYKDHDYVSVNELTEPVGMCIGAYNDNNTAPYFISEFETPEYSNCARLYKSFRTDISVDESNAFDENIKPLIPRLISKVAGNQYELFPFENNGVNLSKSKTFSISIKPVINFETSRSGINSSRWSGLLYENIIKIKAFYCIDTREDQRKVYVCWRVDEGFLK